MAGDSLQIAKAGGIVGLWGRGLKRPNRSWPVGVSDPEGKGKAILECTDIAGGDDSGSVNTYGDVQLAIQALQRGGLDEAVIGRVSYLNYSRVLRTALAA